MIGTLTTTAALDAPHLLAEPVAEALRGWPLAERVLVAEIDPALSDTAAFCRHYGVPLSASANCVIIAATRAGQTRHAACLVPADMRADVNGVVRRHLDARRASFAPMDDAVAMTGMEYGGITPMGLPKDWPVLIDPAVTRMELAIIGAGVRRAKIAVPGALLVELPTADVLDGLAR